MSQRENLIDNLEEALFAVLAFDYMELEGEQLLQLNEQLKASPDAVSPKNADEEILKMINRSSRKTTKQKSVRRRFYVYRIVCKAALIACSIMLFFTTAFAVSPNVREETLKLLIQITDVSVDFSFDESVDESLHINNTEGKNAYQLGGYRIPRLPKEFLLVCTEKEDFFEIVHFENADGKKVSIEVLFGNGQLSIDTENVQTIEQIVINEFEGLCVQKDDRCNYYLADKVNGCYIKILGTNVDQEFLSEIAEGIYWVNQG